MVAEVISLSQLPIGASATVCELHLPDEVQHHLMHMGFVPEARVVAVRRAPTGDPTVYSIDGFEIALRRDTAGSIEVSLTGQATGEPSRAPRRSPLGTLLRRLTAEPAR